MTSRLPGDLTEEFKKEKIPLNAYKIIVKNGKTSEENYSKCYSFLLSKDYSFEEKNKENGSMVAVKSFDDFHVRLNIICAYDSTTVTSEWRSDDQNDLFSSKGAAVKSPEDWKPAKWTNKVDRLSVSFISEFILAKILDGQLNFVVPDTKNKKH